MHTGLSYDQHRVFHLTDGPKAGFDDIYRMLIKAGHRVFSMASMNVAGFSSPGSVFVPDPWSEKANASPVTLNLYTRFIGHNVREYSNARAGISLAEQARFLAFAVANGLRASTVMAILGQLAAEHTRDRRLSWRRVALLDALQFDIFARLYQRNQPSFASFFANSIAHLQHGYWRHMAPEAFTVRPEPAEIALYGDAIRFGYQAMDRLLGRFRALARRHDARLMFVSALSQQPFLRYEAAGGQHFHRLHDVTAFLLRLGIAPADVTPTMTHQYMARFADTAAAQAARARLAARTMPDGRAVFGLAASDAGGESLYFGCQIASLTDMDTPITDTATGNSFRFGAAFYRIEAIKSGCHHPDGCLWIENDQHTTHADTCSILDLLPTQLDLLGVPMPAGAFAGRSLVPLLTPPMRRLAG